MKRREHAVRAALGEMGSTLVVAVLATAAMFVLLNVIPPDRTVAEANEPLITGYVTWAGNVITGDFGHSLYASRTVGEIVRGSLPKTLLLLSAGLLASFAFYSVLGWRMALSPHPVSVAAREGLGIVSLIPNFLLAFLIRPHFVRIDPTPLTAAVAAVSITLLLVLANGLLLEAQRTLAAVLAGESSRPYVQSLRARRLPVGLAMLRNAAGVLLSTWASHLPRLVTALFILCCSSGCWWWRFGARRRGFSRRRSSEGGGRDAARSRTRGGDLVPRGGNLAVGRRPRAPRASRGRRSHAGGPGVVESGRVGPAEPRFVHPRFR
jgi:hypothetical protein